MAQVGIVRIGSQFYREYAIEQGDHLYAICLRFGQPDWSAVYHSDVNRNFQDRFPDPDQIDFVNSVNLFIPLAAAHTSGRKRRGKPIGDFLVVRIADQNGAPYANQLLRQTGPGVPTDGAAVITSQEGDVITANPAAGDWFIVSTEVSLTPVGDLDTAVPPRQLDEGDPEPVLSDPVPLVRNDITELVARPLHVIRCPMCWQRFAVTVQSPAGTAYACPLDGFDWATIVADIETDEMSFLTAPLPPQDPSLTPNTLRCRGIEGPISAAFGGSVPVYWDESRFAYPDGGDYQLWATDPGGTTHTSVIIGRHTWGAAAPHLGGTSYGFHLTKAGASPAYSFAIASNEVEPLRGILHWITIHHSTDAPSNSFATAIGIQNKHFIDIGDGGPGADIGYDYIVDGNGAIYEGRPLGIKGSHVPLFNGGNVGIVLAGDFQRAAMFGGTSPTPPQLAAMTELVDTIANRFGINSATRHQERDQQAKANKTTDCPGQRLIPLLGPMRAKYPAQP